MSDVRLLTSERFNASTIFIDSTRRLIFPEMTQSDPNFGKADASRKSLCLQLNSSPTGCYLRDAAPRHALCNRVGASR